MMQFAMSAKGDGICCRILTVAGVVNPLTLVRNHHPFAVFAFRGDTNLIMLVPLSFTKVLGVKQFMPSNFAENHGWLNQWVNLWLRY